MEFKIVESELHETEQQRNDTEAGCGGLIYRFVCDTWIGSDGDVNFRYRFRWIKSKSCTGCNYCSWLLEELGEHVSWHNQGYPNSLWVEPLDIFKPGKLYKFKIIGCHTDWETGIIDDIDFGFEEVKE